MCTVDYATTCMRTHQQSAYAQVSPLYFLSILYLTRNKLFQAIYCFSVLQVTESWAGPWNKVLQTPLSESILITTYIHRRKSI